ncbi:ankyrin repeat domain-containing protein [Pyxidicoccus sp. 3LG]
MNKPKTSPQECLGTAVESGSLDEARAAVGAGADVNAADEYGETPLTRSVSAGGRAQTSTELVEYLLSSMSPNMWTMTSRPPPRVKSGRCWRNTLTAGSLLRALSIGPRCDMGFPVLRFPP